MEKIDANDVENLAEVTRKQLIHAENELTDSVGWETAESICRNYPNLRPPVITGLLREGEIMNIIAPPKSSKTFFAYNLAYHVINGRNFLIREWQTCGGPVAIIDMELHKETIAYRLNMVLRHLNFDTESNKNLYVQALRGKKKTLYEIHDLILALKIKKIKLIILDCLYKLLPEGKDENSNSDMNIIFNYIECIAASIPDCGIVLVHHTSKGNQKNKGITDVGSGAGVFSRSVDSHIILRQHKNDGCFVVEGVPRSFAPFNPIVIKFEYPIYKYMPELNPEDFKEEKRKSKSSDKISELDDENISSVLKDGWHKKADIALLLKENFNLPGTDSRLILDNLILKHNKQNITVEDGEQEMGSEFLIKKEGNSIKIKRRNG